MRILCLVVAGIVSFATTVSAATLDYELRASYRTQLPLTMFVEDGYTFGVSSSASSAAIFDTYVPGDRAIKRRNFKSGKAFRSTKVSAVHDDTFTFFGASRGMAKVLLESIMKADKNQTGKTGFPSKILNIGDVIRFPYSGPGYDYSPVPSPIPIPAALPLLAGGLGLLGLLGWRRKRNAAETS